VADANAEFRGAYNVSVFGTKSEGHSATLWVRDCRNIFHTGHAGNAEPRSCDAATCPHWRPSPCACDWPGPASLFRVTNCSECRFANLWSQTETAPGFVAFWGARSAKESTSGFSTPPMDASVLVAISDSMLCEVNGTTVRCKRTSAGHPATFSISCGLAPAANRASSPPTDQARVDVLVYGATPGGVAAAIAARRVLGPTGIVVLLEGGAHVGGIIAGGMIDNSISGDTRAYGGLPAEAFRRAAVEYGVPAALNASCFLGEPHVYEHVFRAWLAAEGVVLRTQQVVASVQTSKIADRSLAGGAPTITSVTLAGTSEVIAAAQTVDATYEVGSMPSLSMLCLTCGHVHLPQQSGPFCTCCARTPSRF